jgi:methylenetetrahydrofolate--tRNA-(uracil-5-)-methyltransferase
MPQPIHIVGGGLAGSEAAWQIANAGVPVVLHEMRPARMTEAHKTDGLAELVCSNSFRSDDAATNAVGLLHEEMRRAGSLVMAAGDAHKLPAGGALAVDRDRFSADVTAKLAAHPRVAIERGEVAGLPPPEWESVIIATGPLTSPALSAAIQQLTGETELASSTPSPPSCTSTPSTRASRGGSRATTSPGLAAPAPTTSTAP